MRICASSVSIIFSINVQQTEMMKLVLLIWIKISWIILSTLDLTRLSVWYSVVPYNVTSKVKLHFTSKCSRANTFKYFYIIRTVPRSSSPSKSDSSSSEPSPFFLSTILFIRFKYLTVFINGVSGCIRSVRNGKTWIQQFYTFGLIESL